MNWLGLFVGVGMVAFMVWLIIAARTECVKINSKK